MIGDVRQAARTLRGAPAFAATAILTLALGIGANTAVFGVVNALLFRPLPVNGADRLIVLASAKTPSPSLRGLSYPEIANIAIIEIDQSRARNFGNSGNSGDYGNTCSQRFAIVTSGCSDRKS